MEDDSTKEGRQRLAEKDQKEFRSTTRAVAGISGDWSGTRPAIVITGPNGAGLRVGRQGEDGALAFSPINLPESGFALSREAVSELRDFLNILGTHGDEAFALACFSLACPSEDNETAKGGAA